MNAEIRRLKRRVRVLTAALSYASSKFLGESVALAMIADGHGRLNLEGARVAAQEGHCLCSDVLQSGEYMNCDTVDRVIGKRIARANRAAKQKKMTGGR